MLHAQIALWENTRIEKANKNAKNNPSVYKDFTMIIGRLTKSVVVGHARIKNQKSINAQKAITRAARCALGKSKTRSNAQPASHAKKDTTWSLIAMEPEP